MYCISAGSAFHKNPCGSERRKAERAWVSGKGELCPEAQGSLECFHVAATLSCEGRPCVAGGGGAGLGHRAGRGRPWPGERTWLVF